MMHIRIDDLQGVEVQELLREHLRGMAMHSPPESIHALDLDALRKPDITFWTAWEEDELLGCGALKELDSTHGELKSMRTAERHLRKGVAKHLVLHIVEEAKRRGYARLSLETGSGPGHEAARRLYARCGFTDCGPFADYAEDPHSMFMTLMI
jgi:putative acetyltransferase